MKVLREGHLYELENFENKEGAGQTIQFIEKIPGSPDLTTLVTVHDGTTNEDLLAVIIDRLNYLNGKFPCRENALAITNIQTGLHWLNERTRNRQARGVEGAAKA